MQYPSFSPNTLQNVEVVPPLGPRQPVPGTSVSLCPPRGFSWSEGNRAWDAGDSDTRIKVLQFKGQSFYQRRMRIEQLLMPGDAQIDKWERREGQHGLYPSLQLAFRKITPTLLSDQPEITCHRVFAYGNDEFLILATANYSVEISSRKEAEILASLHSLIFHHDGIFGDFPAHARFSLDLQESQLSWIPGKHANPDGPFTFQSHPQAATKGLQVVIELKRGEPDARELVMEALFKKNFFSSYQVMEAQKITVKGIPGYEAFAIEQIKSGDSRLEYVAILILDGQFATCTCIAPDDRISHLSTFRKLIQSYRPL